MLYYSIELNRTEVTLATEAGIEAYAASQKHAFEPIAPNIPGRQMRVYSIVLTRTDVGQATEAGIEALVVSKEKTLLSL